MPSTGYRGQAPLNTPGRSGKSGRRLYWGRTRSVAAKRHARRLRRHDNKPWMYGLPLPLKGGRK
jgi:hypothetical protein